jgi:hypothetical protein
MIIADMTFRTLRAAAEVDGGSALHSPIIMRGIVQGYLATQCLFIRRLVDNKNISLRRLLKDIKKNLHLITRENYVSGEGLSTDSDVRSSILAHERFDLLAETLQGSRNRADKIPKRFVATLENWLGAKEIAEVVQWTNMSLAHSADREAHPDVNLLALVPTMEKISTAQRHIVRVAEAVSAYLLRGPIHSAIVPVFHYSQFSRLEMVCNREAVKKAQERWRELAQERDEQWTQGVREALLM